MPPAINTTTPGSSPPASAAASSSAAIDDTALKSTNGGVKKPAQKKPAQKKKSKNDVVRYSQKAKQALRKMHAFFKTHREDDECKGLTFVEQQKVLGKLWKASPENPKNGGA